MGYPKPENKPGEKARRPHCGLKIDDKLIFPLVSKHRGNMSKIADAIGCTRNTIRLHCEANPELKKAFADARERWIDDIEESVLSRAEESGDTALQCFVLKTQARHRGWEQSEAQHTAKDIATAAFDFILNKSKNPAEQPK
jgi:hypothetical protein